MRLGFDFREAPGGSLEVVQGRSLEGSDGIEHAVDPVVIADVDADGRLEVIEATDVACRLRSFDGGEDYVRVGIDDCR